MNRKHPIGMFVFGLIMNFIFRFFYLFIPGVILCFLGIWFENCLTVGLAFLAIDLAVSLIDQIIIRKTALSDSDNPDFNEFMDAAYGEGIDNRQAVMAKVNEILESSHIDHGDAQENSNNRQALLQKLVVYRTLRDSITDTMTLEEMIDAFQQMCSISVGEPDDLLFETGTFNFTGEKLFYFDLVRQFQFMDDDEYVQLHLTVTYTPCGKTRLLHQAKWGSPADEDFFQQVKNSLDYRIVKDLPMVNVDVRVEDT